MAFTEKISLIVDVVTGSASSQLNKLKTDVSNAEGGFGKLKAGASGAFSAIASSPAAIAGAAVAVAGFAAKSISAFENTALAAGKFADATGLSVDASSRLIEVAGDIGISGSDVEGALNKMNKAAQNTPQAFAAAGIEIARTASGAVDVQQTFLNAVDALNSIQDPAKRAAVASQLFGKGWTNMAELIGQGSNKIVADMKAVGDAQAINPEELAKAKALRDAMDDAGDAVGGLSLELGGVLAPAMIRAAEASVGVVKWLDKMGQKIAEIEDKTGTNAGGGGLFGKLTGIKIDFQADSWDQFITKIDDSKKSAEFLEDRLASYIPKARTMADVTKDAADAAKEAADKQRDYNAALDAAVASATAASQAVKDQANAARASSDSTFALAEAQDKLTGFVNGYDDAVKDAKDDQLKLNDIYRDGAKAAIDFADATVAVYEQTLKANGATLSGAQTIELFNQSALQQAATLKGPTRAALIDHIAQINNIPPEKVSEIKALIDQGQVAAAEALLNSTSRTRNAALITQVLGVSAAEAALQSLTRTRNAIINAQIIAKGGAGYNTTGTLHFAQGGEVPGPRGKAQMAVVHGGEQVISNEDQDKMAARPGWSSWGTPGANVTINLPVGSDPTAVRRAFDRYTLRNGSR
jgi:hypothetical protein